MPLHTSILLKIKNRNLAAALAVGLVSALIIVPAIFILRELVKAAADGVSMFTIQSPQWKQKLSASPTLGSIFNWADENLNLEESARDILVNLTEKTSAIFASSLWSIVDLFLILFTLFFLFRDKVIVLEGIKNILPLSRNESELIFSKVKDTIYATVYGTILVACIQGFLGGLMFGLLDLSTPILWGLVMAVLAILPYLGASIVWVPAVFVLGVQGHWDKAVMLALWGGIVVALVDNLIYPLLVGSRLRFHTLLIFFFILGGISTFGASGVMLGPLALAVGNGIFEICSKRLNQPNNLALKS